MGTFRLDIKENILMQRTGSHVGDVLIKMSERPGHCCARSPGSTAVLNKPPRLGWLEVAPLQAPFPWRRPWRWGLYETWLWSPLVVNIKEAPRLPQGHRSLGTNPAGADDLGRGQDWDSMQLSCPACVVSACHLVPSADPLLRVPHTSCILITQLACHVALQPYLSRPANPSPPFRFPRTRT